jgi:hypothetical protein
MKPERAEVHYMPGTLRACTRGAEADAKVDKWGVMCPDPVMIERTRNLFIMPIPHKSRSFIFLDRRAL